MKAFKAVASRDSIVRKGTPLTLSTGGISGLFRIIKSNGHSIAPMTLFIRATDFTRK